MVRDQLCTENSAIICVINLLELGVRDLAVVSIISGLYFLLVAVATYGSQMVREMQPRLARH